MEVITLFSHDSNSKLTLSIFSRLAREGKRILHVDLRSLKTFEENKVGLDISSFLNSSGNVSKYIVSLENNLDVVDGSFHLFESEFLNYSNLFKLDYFEKNFLDLSYDYIIFEVSPTISMVSLNALFASSQVMCFSNFQVDNFSYSIANFLTEFNKMYGKKIILSKVFMLYGEKFKKQDYSRVVFDFSSKIISYPIPVNKKHVEFKSAMSSVCESLLIDLGAFLEDGDVLKDEYLNIINRTVFND